MAIAGYEFPGLDARIDSAVERMPTYAQLPHHMREGHRIYLETMVAQREKLICELGQDALFSLSLADEPESTSV